MHIALGVDVLYRLYIIGSEGGAQCNTQIDITSIQLLNPYKLEAILQDCEYNQRAMYASKI